MMTNANPTPELVVVTCNGPHKSWITTREDAMRVQRSGYNCCTKCVEDGRERPYTVGIYPVVPARVTPAVLKSLSKTAAELLAEVLVAHNTRVGLDWGHQARRRFGHRRHNAAVELRAKGLVTLESLGSTPLYKHGYGINGTSFTTVVVLVK